MPDLRDIRVVVHLSAEEYLALKALAGSFGSNNSAMVRGLIKRALRDYAIECRTSGDDDSAEEAQEK